MSTRSAIIFIGAENCDGSGTTAIRLYQHCDGYPTDVLPTLQSTMKAVRKKMAEHWQHVSYRHPGVDFDFLTVPINAGLPPGLACFWVQRKAANAISGGSALHMQRKVA